MLYTLEFKVIDLLRLVFMLICLSACNEEHGQVKYFRLGESNAAITDYLYLSNSENQSMLFIEDRINCSFEVYNLDSYEKMSSVSFIGNKANSPPLQAIISLNKDTLLVLRKNDPHLYFFNQYGHQIDRWDIAENFLPHFSTTHNFPTVYRRKLYIPFFPVNPSAILDRMEAYELIVDLEDQSVDTISFSFPARKQMGLRHHLAKRTIIDSKLVYLWGNSEMLIYDLMTRRKQAFKLDSMNTWVDFEGNFLEHSDQQDYYSDSKVYDHIIYNPYQKEIYIIVLLPLDKSTSFYQRDFQILVYNEHFKLLSRNIYNGLDFVYNMSFVSEQGFFISNNHPLSSNYRRDRMTFTKILFE